MAKLKGTNLVTSRELLKSKGEEGDRLVQAKLSPEDYKLLMNTIASSWIPIEPADRIFRVVAEVLFPNAANPCVALGEISARFQMSGIYRFLIMIPTTHFILEQHAAIWKTYHDEGRASISERGDKNVLFSVTGYPALTASVRDVITGFMSGLLNMANTRRPKIASDFKDPQCWQWKVTWE